MSQFELLNNIPGVEDLTNENAETVSGGYVYYYYTKGKWYRITNRLARAAQRGRSNIGQTQA